MFIKLFNNFKEFFDSQYQYKFKFDDSINKINEFSNENFIIIYDDLLIYSFNSHIKSYGSSNNFDEIVKDLFYRNICFDEIEDLRLVDSLQRLFNYKVYKEDYYYKVFPTNIRRTLFSGGCFWCMAHPYYEFKGVIKVLSGYAGGKTLNPTYLETKHGNGYKETVFISYDSNLISYKELLKLYFESIDPFDTDGQFIDKGESYQTQVYFKTINESNIFEEYKNQIEKQYKLKVAVRTSLDSIFYLAEEEHQDFSKKNKAKFLKEEKESGREEYKYINLN